MLFCERQVALIHMERLWVENRFTAEGRLLHRKTDRAPSETRDGLRITRSLPVHSYRLGVFGICDVVSFKPPDNDAGSHRSLLKSIQHEVQRRRVSQTLSDQKEGTDSAAETGPAANHPSPFAGWQIIPVEYKRGSPKQHQADEVQLCAQAMCIEEMLGVQIPVGELFYGKRQRRSSVVLSDSLRVLTAETAQRLHALIDSGRTPSALREPKCQTCSLISVCIPLRAEHSAASEYVRKMLDEG
jgi:CRISPR-associated exonuclease Cas4